ncbi:MULTISPECIES: universal stress protein [Sinomonas]|jgi:nucleotide-binding universal stress UspA family protein|uniref:universal stress protein n=1 Tax=Sinomonas TaxID=596707 RepID=UPI000B5EA336|nr:universal stress protein [Sinomonas sp. R1AF57]ASN53436.1 universal stress protein UspA [Sinomonas sp. R1AF57]
MDSGGGFLVVVGVDGSEHSAAALQWAVDEARLRRGRVRVVTAWHYVPVPSTVEDAGINDALNAAQRVQAKALEAVSADGVEIERSLVRNLPAAGLLDASKDADLLVVGSRGHGGFTGLLLGSVSTQIAHHASCPVLIIRPKAAV